MKQNKVSNTLIKYSLLWLRFQLFYLCINVLFCFPCNRVSAIFDPGEGLSDNAMISVYPIGDEFFCFTESPTIHKIDPVTLETLERVISNMIFCKTTLNVGVTHDLSFPTQCRWKYFFVMVFSVQKHWGKSRK